MVLLPRQIEAHQGLVADDQVGLVDLTALDRKDGADGPVNVALRNATHPRPDRPLGQRAGIARVQPDGCSHQDLDASGGRALLRDLDSRWDRRNHRGTGSKRQAASCRKFKAPKMERE